MPKFHKRLAKINRDAQAMREAMECQDFPRSYIVQNDTVTVTEDLHDSLNILAGRFYSLMGYSHQEGFDYSVSLHPQERMCYQMALEAAYMQQQSGELDG